jgi:MarR family 2-MHQ and catechol resistance regulon transcriptional repressor
MKSTKRAAAATRHQAPASAAALEADLPTATALKLWVVLSRAAAAVADVSRADVERHGLTGAEFAILEALHHKGPLLLGEVQKRVLVSSGGITFLVDRLADRGLVERLACPSDRRARYAALTRRGTKLMRDIFPAHAAAIREAMAGLGRADQRALTEMLKALGKEAARQAADAGPAHPDARDSV